MADEGKGGLLTVGAAAFLLSLVIACTGLVIALRGAVVDVLPPREVLVYKNGIRNDSHLAIAIQIPLINRSADNDVLTDAHVEIGALRYQFSYENVTVSPTRLRAETDTRAYCERQGTNCVPLPQLAIVNSADDVVIVPAGGAHARYYRFRLVCPISLPECAPYHGGYPRTLQALGGERLSIVIRLKFYADGERTIRCSIGPLDRPYILRNGWQSVRCDDPVISGNPVI